MHVAGLVDQLRVWRIDLVADLWWCRRVRRGFLAGLGLLRYEPSHQKGRLRFGYFLQMGRNLRRAIPARPTIPIPKSAKVEGSGVW
jgi:hypothetical protein